ncbi:nascent polypeptide-associated complex protein [Halosegnis rubeus]|jgi:nascent polypeptide-associated complex subunit alpha|uniref:Nascent polypeptide-associated complex protein n=1 Tax=Halosegnis rubeus TaxID=2212850 RepID=A0A5N5U4J4_9EURY|nr:nascent polypeptide-associated complex protein [Halosegnis rubeus]KAB7513367.1 nascent polypeptide-associated complex protein [Halosegnis rubeus]KAB7517350.1 nascent polypeptide-associated complex protein [Halosegnis rubeus]KAB7518417.1 nascent polypeptide-associated complex protein [Halosegnis rubeus]
MFGGGGGGMNPRKMKQMMNQMGIDLTEIDANEVIIRTDDEEYVFEDAEVQKMDAQGQATYQVVGEPDVRPRDADATEAGDASAEEDSDEKEAAIPESDIEIVAGRTGVTSEEAREALEATDGDLAAAVERLE